MKLNRIGGINESNISVIIAEHARAADGLTLVFTRDTATAARLKKELDFFYALSSRDPSTRDPWQGMPKPDLESNSELGSRFRGNDRLKN